MEDWQLEAHQFALGMCNEGIEEILIKLEEEIENGELTLEEAKLILSDYHTVKEYHMKPTNLIRNILTDRKDRTVTEQEKKLLYKAIINSLTSAVVTNIMIGIAQKRRGVADLDDTPMLSDMPEGTDKAQLGAIASVHGELTLDQRNAEDFEEAGVEYSKVLTEAAGHETAIRPFAVAEMCDGIRNDLYDEMFAFTDLAPKTALYRHPPQTDPINYNQPMGIDFNIKFRIRMTGKIDERRAEQVAKDDGKDVEFIRGVMIKDNVRQAASLQQMLPEIIRTAESFDSNYGVDDFTDLPIDQQIRIADKIANTIDNEYQRLYAIKIRGGSLDIANQCKIIEGNWVEVKAWIDVTTKLMNTQSQSRR